ncbi:MAG TPA: Na+/H+ antiporter NhaA [Thermomicrobiales bacterium]|nr:Na+/H+ antiporter NhaA [Thermomicrobiales bacterium]
MARALTPFREFTKTEVSGGIFLFIAAVVALLWANSPWGDSYFDLWHARLEIDLNVYSLEMTLVHWINDGLMVIFFFVVGLEIKREFLVGELSSLRQASLPIAAAAGGAIVPALIYVSLNAGTEGIRGWGVPMATDIAFALGVLALLGSRAPTGLKVFLTALAIADDIIAVLVIAVFYTADLSVMALGVAGIIVMCLVLANRLGVRRPLVYAIFGIALWFAFIESGVHATVAGVLLAVTIPARTRIDADEFLIKSQASLDAFRASSAGGASVLTNPEHQSAVYDLESSVEAVQSPMQSLEHALHPWVAFVIVPIFAFANAGVAFGDSFGDAVTHRIGLGIIIGLIVGKQVGIMLLTFLMVRSGYTTLPHNVGWTQIYGASCLAGIGFTMSLFIADLAFLDSERLDIAKVGILTASVIAGIIGFAILRMASNINDDDGLGAE